MRLFVAIDLPAAEKHVIARELERLNAHHLPIRWLPADSLHITLKFLGNVDQPTGARVVALLRDVVPAASRFSLTLRQFGAFPSLSRPSVFWIGIEPAPGLGELHRIIDDGCAALGFAREERAFRPHITVGKLKARERFRDRAAMDRIAGEFKYKGTVVVDSVQLMRSHLDERGARYETLANVELN